jgi:cytochrome c-type biogenesis protein
MLEATAAVALGAGMLAALNPCGFALLPAYLVLLVTGDQPGRGVALLRALKMTAAMTAGFTAVFAVFGLALVPVATSVQRYLPWLTVVVGLLVAAAGLWTLTGRSLPALVGGRSGAPVNRSARSMFGFGISYALASLTCTIAPFLAVVVASFRADSVLAGSALFLLYAAGMGLVVGSAAITVALAQQSLVRCARRLGPLVPRTAGVLLVLVGGYVAYYGWWEIRVMGGASAEDPLVGAAAAVQRWLATAVTEIGAWGFVLLLSGTGLALVGSSVLGRWRRQARAR